MKRSKLMKHEIIDIRTKKTVKVCKSDKEAKRACRKLNVEYGAIRYVYNGIAY